MYNTGCVMNRVVDRFLARRAGRTVFFTFPDRLIFFTKHTL